MYLADGARGGRLTLQQASYFWPGDDSSSSGFFLDGRASERRDSFCRAVNLDSRVSDI